MKTIKTLFLALLMILSASLWAQTIINVTEKDQDDGTFTNYKNADINSQIVLHLNRTELLKKISNAVPGNPLPPDVEKLLHILNDALEKREEWIKGFADAVKTYEKGDNKDFEAFNGKQQSVALQIISILEADAFLKTYFEESATGLWSQLTYALNKRIADLEKTLLLSPANADIRIRLGGWLVHNNQSSPLHFDGLDTHPVGEYYEVDRWKFIPTKEQLDEITNLQNAIKEDPLKEANLNELFKTQYLSGFISEMENKLMKQWQGLKGDIDLVINKIAASAVKTDLEELLAAGQSLSVTLIAKIKNYKSLKNDTSFTLSSFASTIISDIEELNEARKKIVNLIRKLNSDLTTAVQEIKTAAATLTQTLQNHLQAFLGEIFGKEILGPLAASDKIPEIALEFSEKVLSLSLKDFPDEAGTDLKYAGFRTAGDRVVIKLVVSKGESPVLQETKSLTIYRIVPHIESTVGVIFAHPLSTTAITKDVQMAPYYNLLFKGILGMSQKLKRRSNLANTLLTLDLGLHVSTPDFDKDDVPELGFGIVVSTLKDYLQFGWAYNVFHGTPYLFFGLRIPMPFLNRGGTSNSGTPVDD